MTYTVERPVRPPLSPTPVPRRGRWRPSAVAAALLALGVVYRLVLILLNVPNTDGDESTTGLMALHIAEGRHFPSYFYGDDYMGAFEAYLAAPVVGLFGPSVLALRLPMVLALYVAFGWLMYRLTARLCTRWFAVAVVGLMALGSDHIVSMQLRASGGYPELSAAAALLVLIPVELANRSPERGWRRPLMFGAWGLTVGFVLWDNWLPLPYLAAGAALLIWTSRRELLGRAGAMLAAGAAIGAAPMIAHLLHAAPGQNVLTQVVALSQGIAPVSLTDRLYGGVLVGIPFSTGLCRPDRCVPWQLSWAPVYLALLALAAALAVAGLRATTRADEPTERVRHAGRLALVVAAALGLFLYVRSATAGIDPMSNARYLHALPVSLPAVLWPLWAAARRLRPDGGTGGTTRRAAAVASTAVLACFAATMLIATVVAVRNVPQASAPDRQVRDLITALGRLDADRVYSDYPTCNRLSYLTRERIVCAVVRDDLARGKDRYEPYRRAVDAAADPAYAFPVDSPVRRAFEGELARQGIPAMAQDSAGYRVYRPSIRPDLPW
ncbi:hypothetical protein [Planosporangium mesophilum]|uniref:Glycosyltransferase RgtA/B/C/D-like domain-containing protein n=1 Tax=Planosporangium mesophilum TaxID=689768 RepID=A0A8J3X126_9ACTN|nr:hypothetical protein [Planosporangium mesophilum]NJC84045.1 hypothetical protein [Planosporangium mesophilum]GII22954.1 hypothetical protein Pme01_25510 [Planosporangium mesophilum]